MYGWSINIIITPNWRLVSSTLIFYTNALQALVCTIKLWQILIQLFVEEFIFSLLEVRTKKNGGEVHTFVASLLDTQRFCKTCAMGSCACAFAVKMFDLSASTSTNLSVSCSFGLFSKWPVKWQMCTCLLKSSSSNELMKKMYLLCRLEVLRLPASTRDYL